MTSIVIIGPNGQLGSDLVKQFTKSGWNVIPANHSEVSVEDFKSVSSFFESKKPDFVINTAALHQVAVCEKEVERSWSINSGGALNVARACESVNAKAVFISTDYVFNGELPATESYKTNHSVSPVNVYGSSKAAAEIATLSTNENNLVIRISSVFGSAGSSGKGGNFVETILNKAKSGEVLKVVDDISMSPSYTVDVSSKIEGLLKAEASGTFHCNNSGSVTWNGFAQEILNLVGLEFEVEKSMTDWTATPKRPRNSSLDTSSLKSIGIEQRTWQEALRAYLEEKKHL